MLRAATFRSVSRARARVPAPLFARGFSEGAEQQERSESKELGNPIGWVNPYSGPSQADTSHKNWTYVYPVGIGLILAAALWSRRRNRKAEEEAARLEQQQRGY